MPTARKSQSSWGRGRPLSTVLRASVGDHSAQVHLLPWFGRGPKPTRNQCLGRAPAWKTARLARASGAGHLPSSLSPTESCCEKGYLGRHSTVDGSHGPEVLTNQRVHMRLLARLPMRRLAAQKSHQFTCIPARHLQE